MRARLYVAHPLEPAAGQALWLLINHEIKVPDLVEPEANRDIVRDAGVVGRGEPGDTENHLGQHRYVINTRKPPARITRRT
jgi:hypothetical protein